MNLNYIKNQDISHVKKYLFSKFKGKVRNADEAALTAAYVIIMANTVPDRFFRKMLCIPYEMLTDDIIETAGENSGTSDLTEFIAFLLFYRFDYSAPEGIPELMSELSVNRERSANLFCSDLSLITGIMLKDPSARKFDLYDASVSDIAAMRADILNRFFGADIKIYSTREAGFGKYSFICSNYLLRDRPYSRINPDFSGVRNFLYPSDENISYEWMAHIRAVQMLESDGKAVVITTTGAVLNKNEQNTRRHFIKNGFIEKVISLPEKIFGYTSIRTVLIVFSHGNSTVRFTDAGKCFTPGRRINTISGNDISDIINCSEYTEVPVKSPVFEENGYSLDPLTYLRKHENSTDTVPFEKLILEITRGMQIGASDLDFFETSKKTLYRYLKISDIHNSMISHDLPFLKYLPEGAERYCTSCGDIIISKTGNPVKAAVVTPEDENILVTGNMYIIRPDLSQTDPYYLLAFLSSESGVEALKTICGGSAIKTIPVSALKKMSVPFPEADIRMKIAFEYREKLTEISELSEKIKNTENELKKIYTDNLHQQKGGK